MRIWITGGAESLGERLTTELAQHGHYILSLSTRLSSTAHESVSLDLAEEKDRLPSIAEQYGAPDVVVHAASQPPGRYAFREFFRGNVLTTMNLLDALAATPPKQIIYTSTLSVYAQSKELPFTEAHPPSSALPFAATKRWAEQLLETFTLSQVTVLRFPDLYGAVQENSFVDGLARLALRDDEIELLSRGSVIKDALHVTDAVRAIKTCVDTPPTEEYSLINLGTGRRISTREYAEGLIDAFGSNSRIVLSDRPALEFDCYADIQRAREVIRFQPTELRESLHRYAGELRA